MIFETGGLGLQWVGTTTTERGPCGSTHPPSPNHPGKSDAGPVLSDFSHMTHRGQQGQSATSSNCSACAFGILAPMDCPAGRVLES